ncbi:MAG: hypothetical protein ACRDYU_07980 [Actinomycetes bacterium]
MKWTTTVLPDGTTLEIGRGNRCVHLAHERAFPHTLDTAVRALAEQVAEHAARRTLAMGACDVVAVGAGACTTVTICPRQDELAVILALIGLEEGDESAARVYLRAPLRALDGTLPPAPDWDGLIRLEARLHAQEDLSER